MVILIYAQNTAMKLVYHLIQVFRGYEVTYKPMPQVLFFFYFLPALTTTICTKVGNEVVLQKWILDKPGAILKTLIHIFT